MLSHVWLCDPMDYNPPGSFVHGIFQARILEWVVIPFSEDLPDQGIKPVTPALTGRFFATEQPEGILKILIPVGSSFEGWKWIGIAVFPGLQAILILQ